MTLDRGTLTVARIRSFDKTVRVACVTLLLLTVVREGAAQAVPPDEAWRTLRTEHFRVTFPAGLEALGRRAAERAERAWRGLSEALGHPPSGTVELLVTDHVDTSNGFARWAPYNQIVVFARPPMEGLSLSFFDDWLDLVITHELAHIFHLNRNGVIGSVVQGVFGRVTGDWPVFPNFSTPKWVLEGLATYYESSLSGAGRVLGTLHDMTLRTAALEGKLERVDQVSGTSPTWPAGNTRYVYGSMFLDHLAEEAGPESIARFADAVAGQWIPLRMNSAASEAFGTSFSDAYGDWTRGLEVDARSVVDSLAAREPLSRPERLTRGARSGLFPRVSDDGSRLAYVRADGKSDTQLRIADPDGGNDRRFTRVSNLTNFDWLPDGSLVAAQLEFTDRYRIRSGLVVVDSDGSQRWLAKGLRLDQPSVAPDGRTAVVVQDGQGSNRLVRIDLATGLITEVVGFEEAVHWSYPAISPGGRWIAVGRWEPGARYDLWILDRDGRPVHRVTDDRAVDQAPSWSPDGRWLVWTSDRTGIPNLFTVPIDPNTGRPGEVAQLTNLTGGANYPSISPDGDWLHFSSYYADGWDVERLPFAPEAAFDPFPTLPRFLIAVPNASADFARSDPGVIGPYNPLHTLVPTFWEIDHDAAIHRGGRKIQRAGYGFLTSQTDLVGRHSYALSSLFRTSGRTDLNARYTNRRLGNPVLSASFNQFHLTNGPFLFEPAPEVLDTVFLTERERSLGLTASFVRERMRSRWGLSFGVRHVWETLGLLDIDLRDTDTELQRPDRRLGELNGTVSFSTARAYAFSAVVQQGARGFVRGRARREFALPSDLRGVDGSDRGFREVTGEVSAYQLLGGPGFSRHSLAVRTSFGGAWGPGADAFHFNVGGAAGRAESISGFELFGGRPLLYPVRGYFAGERFGSYAWTASTEYRFPVANVHRGVDLFPFHMDRLSGALFFDAGNAWGPTRPELGLPAFDNPRTSTLASVGAELQADMLLLFNSRLTVRFGVAHRLTEGSGDGFYVRVGTTF